ncbi:helix-turn-helix domain-containing protein [Anaerotignum sp.]
MSEFAKNLRKFRKQKGYSQEKLAKALNYGYTAIANYESGRNEPSLDDLIRLAEALDVTLDELIGMEFTTKEKELISFFKKLNVENKNRILDLIQALQS